MPGVILHYDILCQMRINVDNPLQTSRETRVKCYEIVKETLNRNELCRFGQIA